MAELGFLLPGKMLKLRPIIVKYNIFIILYDYAR